jgi:hypothetical protein
MNENLIPSGDLALELARTTARQGDTAVHQLASELYEALMGSAPARARVERLARMALELRSGPASLATAPPGAHGARPHGAAPEGG